ncbi:MAG: Lrp/AsnC family transcriptional regulator [Candidatus Diapherotrites archaeon]
MQYMKLDATDKKILYYLSINARLSYSVLAANVGVSRESIKNRMENMWKNKVILNFTAILNPPYFGLNFYTLYLNFNKLDATNAKKLAKYMKNHWSAIWVNRCLGKWDYTLLLLAKDSMDITEIIGEIKENFRGLIKEIDFEEVLYEYKYTANIKSFFKDVNIKPLKVSKEGSSLYSLLENESVAAVKDFEKTKIDKMDVEIINLLANNCRVSLQEMSEKLSLPIENIRYKMKRMAEKKVLAALWIAINYGVFGFQWYRIRIRTYQITDEIEKELRKFIANDSNIFWAARILGQNDLHLDVRLKDNKELNEFLEKFNEQFEKLTIDYETIIMTEEPDYNDFAPKIYDIAN